MAGLTSLVHKQQINRRKGQRKIATRNNQTGRNVKCSNGIFLIFYASSQKLQTHNKSLSEGMKPF